MSAVKQACAHVRRGVCRGCENPLKPARAARTDDVTTFGAQLTIALLTSGYNKHGKRRKPRRNHR